MQSFTLRWVKFRIYYIKNSWLQSKHIAGTTKKAYLQGESVWKDQANEALFYLSPAILRKGEFSKGIYTLRDHPMLTSVKSELDLAQYRGITVPTWDQDWYIIRHLTKNLVTAKSQFEIHDKINKGQADFTLSEFNGELSHIFGKVHLSPIPNIKVLIKQTRHFVVRKDMPYSLDIFEALTLGLAKMRRAKMIVNMYQKGGIINPITKHWRAINN
ncbi:hypothetical protein RS130_09065 [Paraglaciecola aquimarina]|uniref:Solute-binding protein family 3/N-terminal domain-containing protein n=1 Tax=Paraglaciecola aquimarina TaxID=1235557 RepID=A0ABU3SVN2_9ALTE|nr:hypothetical protein [Paraglaciecola aquimarina]MDU0354066.1 hypothetical protein [Paraglaciecola aquimarina]